MAITTLDGALAGMQQPRDFFKVATPTLVAGKPQSLFYLAGQPGAGSAPSSGIGGGVHTAPLAGCLNFSNPGAGNTYLSRFQAQATVAGTLWLIDRLWSNSGIDVTSIAEQTFTSSAQIPARDADGTTTGNQVYGAVEVSVATSTNAPTLSLKYTSTTGGTSTGTNIVATAATAAAGSFFPIGLAAGDVGIQKAQSLTLSVTWTAGTIHVILYRVIAKLEIPVAQAGFAIDALTSGFARIYDNSCLSLVFMPNTTTGSAIGGHVIWSQG